MRRSKRFIFILAGVATATVFAQATSDGRKSATDERPASPLAGLEQRTEDGVKYVCGGVGSDEAATLKAAASKYDLMMTFAASTGAYLADVGVTIADARGRSVLDVMCDGPILLVDLPKDGRYRVRAEAEGRTLTRSAQVRERGNVQRIRMAWPVQTVDMGLTPAMREQQTGAGTTSSGSDGERAGESRSGSGQK